MTTEPPRRIAGAARRAFSGVRFRILVYAVLILLFGIVVTVLTMRQILIARLDARAQQEIRQEVTEFRSLSTGVNPATGTPFNDNLEALFDTFLDRNVPNAGEQLLTFVDGRLHGAKAFLGDTPGLERETGLTDRWARATATESGTAVASGADFRYIAVPVTAEGEVRGVFVVATRTDDEREEIEAAVRTAGLVGIVALLIGSLVAYLAAGRVLDPLRELTETARSIEETDLTARIEVTGHDELAELGLTFNGMLDRLEAAFGSQRELIRNVSHELRTPITIIRGHLELLGDDPDERRETVELVTDELDRMNRLVHDLLTLARAERPDFLSPEPFEVDTFMEELAAKARALGEREWKLDLSADSAVIVADRQRLSQAMLNLAGNAIHQTAPGDPVVIGAEAGADASVGARIRFWVADSGPGIPPAEREAVFERFHRGSDRKYSGTGLGLAIVRAIAEAHGGNVRAGESVAGGAELSIVIPASRQPQPAAILRS